MILRKEQLTNEEKTRLIEFRDYINEMLCDINRLDQYIIALKNKDGVYFIIETIADVKTDMVAANIYQFIDNLEFRKVATGFHYGADSPIGDTIITYLMPSTENVIAHDIFVMTITHEMFDFMRS